MNPYHFFVRVLVELYAEAKKRKIETPEKISRGEFMNLNYQLDAIRQGLECIEKYDGVIIADVVGLGKSIIASTIAYNLSMARTIIITPPHLKTQWENYVRKFQLKNTFVESGGKIKDLYESTSKTRETTLYIIDEAHRYRNERTTAYRKLHQMMRAHPKNKVMLLTATPYNNHPKDIYALIKLFQIPSRATLNAVDNFGLRFNQLIAKYNELERISKHDATVEAQMRELGNRMRTLIEPIVIRRSRVDLLEITKYADDLTRQKISLAKVSDPRIINYDLGELSTLYYKTLSELSSGAFIGAKYKPLIYLKNEAKFSAKYEKIFSFNRTQQMNMAKLARRLFVLRFESSPYAFRRTLKNMIKNHELTLEMWQKRKRVAISKSKTLDRLDGLEDDNFTIPSDMLETDFVQDVRADLAWLKQTYREWFGGETQIDPKQKQVEKTVRRLLRDDPKRKIVVFTSFADTAQYVVRRLREAGLRRTLLYMSENSHALKKTVACNFDAALPEDERSDEYDIIVATDALSEGFNLHRAGVIINYDIPYNPTRVIQRIGRINRIDQKMFDELLVYNLFPTAIGEEIVKVKGISSLKMLLINQIIGNDMKVLTRDEEIESFFKHQFREIAVEDEVAWDNEYRNFYNEIRNNTDLINTVQKIPKETSIVRQAQNSNTKSMAVVRRGMNVVFLGLGQDDEIRVLIPKEALEILATEKNDLGSQKENYESLQKFKQELARPYELPKMLGNRGYALDVIEALREAYESERIYLTKLYNTVRKYDDLCMAELQDIVNIDLVDIKNAVKRLKEEIPEWYLDAIQEKVNSIEKVEPEIILVEDFVE